MRTISNNVFTPNGWVRVDRLVVRFFGKEITLRLNPKESQRTLVVG